MGTTGVYYGGGSVMDLKKGKCYRNHRGSVFFVRDVEPLLAAAGMAVKLFDYAIVPGDHLPSNQGFGVYHLCVEFCHSCQEISKNEFDLAWVKIVQEALAKIGRGPNIGAFCLPYRNTPRRRMLLRAMIYGQRGNPECP